MTAPASPALSRRRAGARREGGREGPWEQAEAGSGPESSNPAHDQRPGLMKAIVTMKLAGCCATRALRFKKCGLCFFLQCFSDA